LIALTNGSSCEIIPFGANGRTYLYGYRFTATVTWRTITSEQLIMMRNTKPVVLVTKSFGSNDFRGQKICPKFDSRRNEEPRIYCDGHRNSNEIALKIPRVRDDFVEFTFFFFIFWFEECTDFTIKIFFICSENPF